MANELTSIRYTNFDGLLNSDTSDFLMGQDELKAVKNVWTYTLGRLEKVPGYQKAAATVVVSSEDVDYLHWYFDTTSKTDYLFAVSDTGSNLTLRYIAPDATSPITVWTTVGSILTSWDTYAGSNVDMENYLGRTFVVGHKTGTTYLPSATVKGTTFSTTDTSLTDMPQAKYVVRYRDLLYVGHTKVGADVYPSRVYYSDEPTDREIGWKNTLTQFVEFGYDDGDEITGMAEALDRLIVFKERSMWKYDESERKKIADFGCDSYKSIIKVNNILYWFNRFGFWRWRGAEPELISAKAQSYIDAIDQAKLNEVVATKYNGFEYRAFIGDVTVDGYTYQNAWFCWDTRRETCYIRCTFNEVKSAAEFKQGSKVRAYFGDNAGYVYNFATKVDKLFADDGNEIDSFFVTQAYDYGVPEDVKFVNHMTTFATHAEGLKCAIDVNKNRSFNETNIAQLDKNIGHADITSSGNRYSYKFYEKSDNKSFEFEGFTIATKIKEHEL